MSLVEMNVSAFADALASRAAVPGGGGASALVAALGAGLGTMVGNYTVGKKKYADVEAEVQALMAEAEALRAELLSLVDADATAFEPLSRAYAIPKDDPTRGEVMEQCLRDAAAVPMQILRLSCRGIELQREFAAKGSSMVVSDAGTGVVFLWAALYGAALNVKVNTKLMADRAYAQAMNAEVDALMDSHWKIADAVYEDVYRRFC
jgi:formiminotetrahydrofolate cyclodeaminase